MNFQELRISFTWVESRPDDAAWSGDLPAAFLQSGAAYASRFDAMVGAAVDPNPALPEATPPWPTQTPAYRHYFWRHYLGKEPRSTGGKHAFRKLVPFRIGFPARVRSPEKGVRVIRDGFVYPHAIAVTLTVRVALDLALKQGVADSTAMKRAVAAYRKDIYTLAWVNQPASSGTLATVAGELLDNLRQRVFGSALPGVRSPQPFIVASVIRGSLDEKNRPQEFGDGHKVLQGLCTLDDKWQSNKLAPYAESLLRHRNETPEAHVVYRNSTARAIWFPGRIGDSAIGRTVGCYQRNLTLLHLQLLSMLEAIRMRAELVLYKEEVPAPLQVIAEAAAREIGGLYNGTTYRSMSAKAYLDDHAQELKQVDAARKDFGLDPLVPPPKDPPAKPPAAR